MGTSNKVPESDTYLQNILKQLATCLGPSLYCGYISLLEGPDSQGPEAAEDVEFSVGNFKPGSPAGDGLDSSSVQLLEEEIDNIDSPVAGEVPRRPQQLCVNTPHQQKS